MRAISVFIASGVFAVGAMPLLAQGLPDGPLTAPSTALAASSKITVVDAGKKRKPHHAAKTPVSNKHPRAESSAIGDETSRRDGPVARKAASVPDDPLSLGMKWNGSNDNGSQTRVQNYNGNAAGTGAEVGLKLHF